MWWVRKGKIGLHVEETICRHRNSTLEKKHHFSSLLLRLNLGLYRFHKLLGWNNNVRLFDARVATLAIRRHGLPFATFCENRPVAWRLAPCRQTLSGFLHGLVRFALRALSDIVGSNTQTTACGRCRMGVGRRLVLFVVTIALVDR